MSGTVSLSKSSRATSARVPKSGKKTNPIRRKPFTHRDALRRCYRAATTGGTGVPVEALTDLEALYVFVAACAPAIRPQFVLLRRYYVPKPSAEARKWILTTVQKLSIEADERDGWGYGVTIAQLLACPDCRLRYSALRNYLSKLAAGGELVRVATGLYQLPTIEP